MSLKNQMNKEVCGTCKWHQYSPTSQEWVCVNDTSEYCTDETPYEHTCEDWGK